MDLAGPAQQVYQYPIGPVRHSAEVLAFDGGMMLPRG